MGYSSLFMWCVRFMAWRGCRPVRCAYAETQLTRAARWLVVVGLAWLSVGCDRSGNDMDLFNLQTYTAAPYAEVLKAAVVDGRVDYRVVRDGYLPPLEKYLELVAEFGPKTHGPGSDTRLFFQPRHSVAYYLNAYHARLIQTWLQHGAADPSPGFALDPAWLDVKHSVEGRELSLNELADLARRAARFYDERRLERNEVGPKTRDLQFLVEFAVDQNTADAPPLPTPTLDPEAVKQQLVSHILTYFGRPDTFRVTEGSVSAPAVLQRVADTVPQFPRFLEAYIPDGHPEKFTIIRAARDGTLTYRPVDLTFVAPYLDPPSQPSP